MIEFGSNMAHTQKNQKFPNLCNKLTSLALSLSNNPAMLDPNDSNVAPQFRMDPDGLRQPLFNLSMLHSRMDQVQRLLSGSLNTNTIIGESQMEIVSQAIASAISQTIVNGAALLSSTGLPKSKSDNPSLYLQSGSSIFDLKHKHSSESDLSMNHSKHDDVDIVELDAVELLPERLHFCHLCGKGFKRDANLRMHMRAHGNEFKTLEALAKPEKSGLSSTELTRGGRTRFSCPCAGCSRIKLHKKFKPLKSLIRVKNHFKRSHCPKMYSCNRCNKKSFSVLADLKTHLKHCGETKWKCSCGTSFSGKDKSFGHMTLFEGHMPAEVVVEDAEDGCGKGVRGMEWVNNTMDDGFFDRFLEGLSSVDGDFCIQELLGCSDVGFDLNS